MRKRLAPLVTAVIIATALVVFGADSSTAQPSLIGKLRGCVSIEDMTKERLDCYDEIVPPEPKANPPKVLAVTDCRYLREEDERIACFNRFVVLPAAGSRSNVPSISKLPHTTLPLPHTSAKTTYIKKGRGGCGSRGGAGYRLPNGKCASRKR